MSNYVVACQHTGEWRYLGQGHELHGVVVDPVPDGAGEHSGQQNPQIVLLEGRIVRGREHLQATDEEGRKEGKKSDILGVQLGVTSA